MNAQVRAAGAAHAVVVDGRDIGTVVFPDAALKIFLVADPWERATRRLVQRLGRRPTNDEVAEETERLVRRDAADRTQTVQARDAVLLDTGGADRGARAGRGGGRGTRAPGRVGSGVARSRRTARVRRALVPPAGGAGASVELVSRRPRSLR